MHQVMWDLARSDEFVSQFMAQDTGVDTKMESLKLYEQVYRLHNTTHDIFQKSLAYYQQHPKLLKVIMDSLRGYERKIYEQQNVDIKARTDSFSSEKGILLTTPDSLIQKKKRKLDLR